MLKRPLMCICIGIVLLQWLLQECGLLVTGHRAVQELDLPRDGVAVTAEGKVLSRDEQGLVLGQLKMTLRSGEEFSFARKYRLQVRPAEDDRCALLPVGANVCVRGEFGRFSPASNPGEFSGAAYYGDLNFLGKIKDATVLSMDPYRITPAEWITELREAWLSRLRMLYPESEASIMADLLLGQKKDLDPEIRDLYRRSGIAHILSISALHISILGLGIFHLLRKIGIRQTPAAILCILFLFGYGVLTGGSTSAVRAIGTVTLMLLARIIGRTPDTLTSLSVLAVLLLLQNPARLYSCSFLLSFGCVTGILVTGPALEGIWDGVKAQIHETIQSAAKTGPRCANALTPFRVIKRNVRDYLGLGPVQWGRPSKLQKRIQKAVFSFRSNLFASMGLTLTTLPVQLYFFYEVPRYSIFLNLFILPFMSVLIFAGFFAMLLPGAGFLGTVSYWILQMFEGLCLLFEKLPAHTWNPGCPRPVQLAVYYPGLLALICLGWGIRALREEKHPMPFTPAGMILEADRRIRKNGKGRRKALVQRFSGSSVVLLLVLLFCLSIPRDMRGSVTFLSVGQGDGIVLVTDAGEVYLFDGGSTSRTQVGSYVLKPYLKYMGISEIDGIFLSHADADHVNGSLELLEKRDEWGLRVGALYLTPQMLSEENELTARVLETAGRSEKDSKQEVAGRSEKEKNQEVPQSGKAAAQPDVRVETMTAGTSWTSGSTAFSCLHPAADFPAEDPNAASECFLVTFGAAGTLLLTGDVEGKGEEALMRKLPKVDVLKVAHHGSRNSTPTELLELADPGLAILSAGSGNRYGHPHEETLQRLADSGTPALCTIDRGAITVRFTSHSGFFRKNARIRVQTFCN